MEIDCSIGEGGGQVLRTTLALACVLKKNVTLTNIRAKRSKPGLQAQHLTGVNALAQMTEAQVTGNKSGETTLSFSPNKAVKGGNYSFNIGTAGSVTLLAQTILPALAFADKPSAVEIIGGTDVPFSPPFDYFSRVLCPTLHDMGLRTETALAKRGFYPVGGGKGVIRVYPVTQLKAMDNTSRGKLKKVVCNSIVGLLPENIALRQAQSAQKTAASVTEEMEIVYKNEQTACPGTSLFIKAEYENALAGFSCLGKKGKSAEDVGREAAQKFVDYHKNNYTFDEHMADQLMIFCALANGNSEYTAKQTSHSETNAEVLKKVAGVSAEIDEDKYKIRGLGLHRKY